MTTKYYIGELTECTGNYEFTSQFVFTTEEQKLEDKLYEIGHCWRGYEIDEENPDYNEDYHEWDAGDLTYSLPTCEEISQSDFEFLAQYLALL